VCCKPLAIQVLCKRYKELENTGPTGLFPALCWEVKDYIAYSANLVASDFHIFGSLEKHLAGKRFSVHADMKHSLIS
jgi:hypothetical protein